jgi:hypothetical protein
MAYLIDSTYHINGAYTDLAYNLTSSNSTQPQFRYIMDVYVSGSSDRIIRQTQTPNETTDYQARYATFVPSRIFQDQIQYLNVWETPTNTVVQDSSSFNNYELQFGEQYGTSTSSSITVYPDLTSITASIMPSTKDAQDYTFYYTTASTDIESGLLVGKGIANVYIPSESILSNCPNHAPQPSQSLASSTQREDILYLSSSDYHSVSVLNPSIDGSGNIAQALVYDLSGSLSSTVNISYTTSSNNELVHIGVGPANIEAYSSQTWDSVSKVNIRTVRADSTYDEFEYRLTPGWSNNAIDGANNYTPNYCNDRIRFAFINRYGVWDYYNVFNPVKKRTDVKREHVSRNRLMTKFQYSLTGNNPFNPTAGTFLDISRGKADYYRKLNDVYIVNTDWLTKRTAYWLEELFESPSVFIQETNGFIPIVLTVNNIQKNVTQSRNKLFQYNIQFEYSNPRVARTFNDSRDFI